MIAQIVQKLIAPIGQGQGAQSGVPAEEAVLSGEGEGQFAGLMAEGGEAPPEESVDLAGQSAPAMIGAELAQAVSASAVPSAEAVGLVWAGTGDAAVWGGDPALGGDGVVGADLDLGQGAFAQGRGGAAAPAAPNAALVGQDLAQAAPAGHDAAQGGVAGEGPVDSAKLLGVGLSPAVGTAQILGAAPVDGPASVQGEGQLAAGVGSVGATALWAAGGATSAVPPLAAAPLQRQSTQIEIPQLAAALRARAGSDTGQDAKTGDQAARNVATVAALTDGSPPADHGANPAALAGASPTSAGAKALGAVVGASVDARQDGPRKDRLQASGADGMAPMQLRLTPLPPPAPNAGEPMGAAALPAAAQGWAAGDPSAPFGLAEGLGSAMAIGEIGLRGHSGASTAAATPVIAAPLPSTAVVAQMLPYAGAAQSGPVEVTLSPAELGQLKFEILHRGEAVQILLSAERADTLDLLRRNSDQLLADFRNAGFSGASLSFGGWGAGQGPSGQPAAEDAPPQDAPEVGPALAQSAAAFARARPMLDPARSLNLRL